MILPTIQGKLDCTDFFIFAACDEKYFDEFAIPLIKSIQHNSGNQIHLHIFNPRGDQLEFCQQHNVSFTFENITRDQFKQAEQRWKVVPTNALELDQYNRVITAMAKSSDSSLIHRIEKTYYACARFIRLSEILTENCSVFAIDIDAIVRKQVPVLSTKPDLFIHRIEGKKARFLAGGMYINNLKFLQDYATILKEKINNDYLYWGLDQDLLENIVSQYKFDRLPISLIDWEMRDSSYIWTAKGKRKDLKIFTDEQKKYAV